MQKRRLAAIMFTDIVGYTTLMGQDEKHALEKLKKSHQAQKDIIEKHGGKWLKEIGAEASLQRWLRSYAVGFGKCGTILVWRNGNTVFLWCNVLKYLKCPSWGMPGIFPLGWSAR